MHEINFGTNFSKHQMHSKEVFEISFFFAHSLISLQSSPFFLSLQHDNGGSNDCDVQ